MAQENKNFQKNQQKSQERGQQKDLQQTEEYSPQHQQQALFQFPSFRFPFSLFGDIEEDKWLQNFSYSSTGLSVSEDDKNVYIEAAVPGISPDQIEITFDKGILWVKAQKTEKETDTKRKYYTREQTSSFSYRLAVPGNIDESKQPEAICKDGILHIIFHKTSRAEPKKIQVKRSQQ